MNENPEVLFLQLIGSVALLSGRSLWRLCRKKKKSNTVFCILAPRKSGTTTVLKELEMESKFSIIDVKDNVISSLSDSEKREHLLNLLDESPQSFGVKVHPLVKNYIKECRKSYPDKPVILFTSDKNLIEFLKIPKEQVACLIPSLSYLERIKPEMKDTEEHLLVKSREELLQTNYARFTNQSGTDLRDNLSRILGCKR